MDYVSEISIVIQATDGVDKEAIVKAGIVELLIRYFMTWRLSFLSNNWVNLRFLSLKMAVREEITCFFF